MAAAGDGDGVTAELATFPLFSAVAPDHLSVLGRQVRRVRAVPGRVLFRQGDPASGFFCLVSGLVTLSLGSPGGTEKVVEIVGAGEHFAEAVVFSGAPYPVAATALAESRLLLCPADAVLDLVATDPAFARAMLAGLSTRLHRLVADVESYTLRSATQRVVAWLLAQQPPGQNHGQPYTVRLRTTKAVLASRIGVAPETLSRSLRALADDAAVSGRGRAVHVRSRAALLAQLA